MPASTIRLLLVDDHLLVRQGLRALLAEHPAIEVVGEAGDGQAAIAQVQALQPDVVLMDLVMPVMDGIQATRQISARWPHVKILVLTSFATDDKVFPAIQAGALGYLLKEASSEALLRAIVQVHRGEPSLQPSIAIKVLHALGQAERPADLPLTPQPLTSREHAVLLLVAQGLENQAIAARLAIAEVTVRTHLCHILAKLHLANRVQAALYALREGLATLEPGADPAEPSR